MQIKFIKNIQFTRLVKADGRLREFNFRKRNPELYDTDVCDERGNRYVFKMVREADEWVIGTKDLPAWLTESQHLIHQALAEEESRSN